MFDLFKKSAGAPDVGQEEEYDATHEDEIIEDVDEASAGPAVPEKALSSNMKSSGGNKISSGGSNGFEAERINARVDSVVEWIKQFYERFAYMSESIGQIRAMSLESEKRISRSMAEAEKAIDIVKEVKPEQLRIDYQKVDLKVSTLIAKLESNRQFMNEAINEVNDLKRKSEVFVGTEGLMKLNEDTKKDLVETQKLSAKSKMHADKVQELFMEVRKSFADMQRAKDIIDSFEASYSGLKSSIDKLRLDSGNIVKRDDYLDFKKDYGKRLAVFETGISEVKDLRKTVDNATSLIETNLSVARKNEDDIIKLALKTGEGSIKGVSDYDNQLVGIVDVVETLSKSVNELKLKIVSLEKEKNEEVSSLVKNLGELQLANVTLSAEIKKEKQVVAVQPVVAEAIIPVVEETIVPVVEEDKEEEKNIEEKNIDKIIDKSDVADAIKKIKKKIVKKKVSKKKSKSKKKS